MVEAAASPPVPGPPGAGTLTESVERAGLRFHSRPEDHRMALLLAALAPRARERIAAQLGGDPGGRFEIYLAHDAANFRTLLGGAPAWMSGVAHSRVGWAALRLDPRGEQPLSEIQETFLHELSHLMLRRAAGEASDLPRWFVEGFAMYQSGDWSFGRVRSLTRALLRDQVFPLRDLRRGFPAEGDAVQLAYAQSLAFVGYLIKQDAGRPFAALVGRVAAGQDFDTALATSFGTSLADLEAGWHEQLELGYGWVPVLLGGSTLWAVASLLFLLAYWRRRRERKLQLAQWEHEERMLVAGPVAVLVPGSADEGGVVGGEGEGEDGASEDGSSEDPLLWN